MSLAALAGARTPEEPHAAAVDLRLDLSVAWWNPAVEDQASDRAHRLGQTRPVTVYRLIAQGTVEEKMLSLHRDKRAMVDALLAGTEAAGRLSAADLLGLLGQGAERLGAAP